MTLGRGLGVGAYVPSPLPIGLGSEAALLDAWRFAEWEEKVHARFERDYVQNAPILRGTQIYIDQDAAGDASGGGGTGTSGDPYLCDTWGDVCDLLMSTLTLAQDTAIIFRDGDYYEGTYSFQLPVSNLTICTRDQYAAAVLGAIMPAPTAKVFVNHFTIKIAASASWTNSATDTYYIAEPTQVYTIRKQTERLTDGEQFRIMPSEASLATLAGNQRGFWYDTVNDRVYIKVTAGENPADFAWECVDGLSHGSNAVDGANAGTIHLQNGSVTACRITGIRSDGYRFRHALDQGYGIKTDISGTRFVVVDNCEAYFNCRHNMGCASVNTAGGVTVYQNVTMGFCWEDVATNFVHYNGQSDFTSYGRFFTHIAGSIPRDNSTLRARGRGAFVHAAVPQVVRNVYWFDHTATDHEFGVNGVAIVDGGATQAVDRDVDVAFSDMKVYIVRLRDTRSADGASDQAIINLGRMTLQLNNVVYNKPSSTATSCAPPGACPRSTVAVNCVNIIDLSNLSSGDFGVFNGGGASSSISKLGQAYNCFLGGIVPTGVNLNFFERSNNSFGTPPSTVFLFETRNCVYGKLSGTGNMRPGTGNNVGQNSNNAYFGMTESNSSANRNRGYDNCTDLVELSAAPWEDTIPQTGDQIFQAGNRPPKAREDRENFRFPSPPDIGTRSSVAAYVPNSVRFDGTNDGMTASTGGSVADGTTIIAAFKIIPKQLTGTQNVFTTRNNRVWFRFENSGSGIVFTSSLVSPAILFLASASSPTGVVALDTPYQFLITASTSAMSFDPHLRCAYKQIGTAGAWTTAFNVALTSTGDIDFTDTQFFVGQGNAGANRMNGCLADLYVGQGVGNALDTALQAKFLNADGSMVQAGQYGQRVTGTAPLIFLRGDFEDFQINNSNLGVQGDFTVTGALAQGDAFA